MNMNMTFNDESYWDNYNHYDYEYEYDSPASTYSNALQNATNPECGN